MSFTAQTAAGFDGGETLSVEIKYFFSLEMKGEESSRESLPRGWKLCANQTKSKFDLHYDRGIVGFKHSLVATCQVSTLKLVKLVRRLWKCSTNIYSNFNDFITSLFKNPEYFQKFYTFQPFESSRTLIRLPQLLFLIFECIQCLLINNTVQQSVKTPGN